MRERYEPSEFEQKWRDRWKESDLFLTRTEEGRPKFYGLDFFPYPSGAGLSVGHCRNFIPTDVLCRKKYMEGYNVLHPMGFDAFGLPAENEAIKRKSHPAPMIDKYAATYQRQMELIGISYDWSRQFKSSDPSYYRWTQWIFKKLYEKGLAERRNAEVNWCPKDKTALANEEVVGGLCERCGTPVEKRAIPQWFFKITDYAQRLIDDLEDLDWPEGIKAQQINWIGRSEGVEFSMDVAFDSEPESDFDFPSAIDHLNSRNDHVHDLLNALKELAQTIPNDNVRLQSLHQSIDLIHTGFQSGKEKIASLTSSPDEPTLRQLQSDFDALEDLTEDLIAKSESLQEDHQDVQTWQELITTLENLEEEFDEYEDTFETALEHQPSDFEVITTPKPPTFRAFTTRIDTIFGVTFCVLAPEHPLVETIKKNVSPEFRDQIESYQAQAKALSDIDRSATTREKTGVNTGAYAINPANGKRVPLFIADYVMMGYGTGAIMAVPAHDQRDFDFSTKYNLDVTPVYKPEEAYFQQFDSTKNLPYSEALEAYLSDPKVFPQVWEAKNGELVNSGEYSGMSYQEGSKAMGDWIVALGIGEWKVNYKLRDWLISRQRYWGCPIPIVYDKEGNPEPVLDSALPVELPEVENYAPGDDGSSPLAHIPDFLNVTTNEGTLGTRETDTMGGFACSSWYFLRFCDPHNNGQAWDPEKTQYWMPVDVYVGGAEHAVMHLLYARFWTKVLYDLGLVHVSEPFKTLRNQGQVLGYTPYRNPREGETLSLGEDGILVSFEEAKNIPEDQLNWKWVRMSKSKGNVVTPDEAVAEYGADALRVFELFVAPFEQAVQWSNEGMQGSARFLSRVFRLANEILPYYEPNWKNSIDSVKPSEQSKSIRRATHQLIKKASEDIERFAFNTYIAAAMTTLNTYSDLIKSTHEPDESEKLAWSEAIDSLILILSPAAPHSADEIWEALGHQGSTYQQSWPQFQLDLAKEETITIAVQVNGKLRDTLEMSAESTKEELETAALASQKVSAHTDGKTIRKVIVIPGKLVNVVAN